jgi:hypothetical protein
MRRGAGFEHGKMSVGTEGMWWPAIPVRSSPALGTTAICVSRESHERNLVKTPDAYTGSAAVEHQDNWCAAYPTDGQMEPVPLADQAETPVSLCERAAALLVRPARK